MFMKRGSGLLVLLSFVGAAALAADTIPAANGVINITPLAHSSVQLEYQGKVIQIDPWSVIDLKPVKPADLILVTDGTDPHHFDITAIARLRKPGAPVVMPASGKEKLLDGTVLSNGESTTAAGIRIDAIGAYDITNLDLPGEPSHPKGVANGYVFTFGGKRIYVAGVTECVPEMKALKDIDLMFLTVNMPIERMRPAVAAACVKALRPKVVYPYHFDNAATSRLQNPKAPARPPTPRTAEGLWDVRTDSAGNRAGIETFKKLLAGEPIEVRVGNFYPGVPVPAQ
jgi:L-ascorbate metabolism protein UlaG (beta-lactamase superfamily)